jgi:hypothetical protein
MTLNLLQHDGCDGDDKYNFARNFTSPILNFFCYNNGYHGIHHVHPGLHWSELKHAHKAEVKPSLHPNLDQWSILGYMFTTFVYPGQRVDYKNDPLVMPPEGDPIYEDEPWFYDVAETYSTGDGGAGDVDKQPWGGGGGDSGDKHVELSKADKAAAVARVRAKALKVS